MPDSLSLDTARCSAMLPEVRGRLIAKLLAKATEADDAAAFHETRALGLRDSRHYHLDGFAIQAQETKALACRDMAAALRRRAEQLKDEVEDIYVHGSVA